VENRETSAERWTDVRRVRRALQVIATAWLLALGAPIGSLLQPRFTPLSRAVALIGVAVFVATYLWVIFRSAPYGLPVPVGGSTSAGSDAGDRRRRQSVRWLPLAILGPLGVVYTVVYGNPWLDLLVFTAVAAAYRLPMRQTAWFVPLVAVVAAGLGVGVNHSVGDAAPAFLLILSVGIGVAGGIYTLSVVRDLRVARGELARLAVAEERLRFARDLHDLLGHSLSLIALKSELAGQLALQAPERAATEMRDVESVARTALREVREAVAGYRQPTVASELAGAREILSAAGILFQSEGELGQLPPRIEAVVAWTIREGITNVIRHSRARTCAIRLSRDAGQIVVEVIDDGRGVSGENGDHASPDSGRSGLAGLAERVTAVGGTVSARPAAPRGFHLVAVVPLPLEKPQSNPTIPSVVTGGS